MACDSTTQRALLDQLAALLGAQPDIVFATLFDSVASGAARPDSDLDIGVLANAPWVPGADRR